MALSKNSILRHAGSFTAREVHVPAWVDENGDDVVLVRGMTVREFEINQARADDGEGNASVMARCILDATGSRVFDDASVGQLAELPLVEAMTVTKAIMEESGLSDKANEQGDAITVALKDAEKNSGPTPDDGSSSS